MQLDVMSRVPVYEQIVDEVERFMLTGAMKPGDQLPSVRGLSTELSINPNTILKAYGELDASGLIFSVPGRGYFISADAHDVLKQKELKKLEGLKQQFSQFALIGIDKDIVIKSVEDAYASALTNGKESEEK